MATDLESLVLSISADTSALKRALTRTEKDAKQTADSIGKSFSNVVPFQKMEQGFNRSAKAMANDAKVLSFQFNDLFTQIQSGTSVVQAFGQQAGQIGQVLGSAGGIRGAASLVGSALIGMVPTVALTAAFAAVTYAAQAYFDTAEEGAAVSLEAATKQLSEIEKIAKAWEGKATPALQGYIDQLVEAAKKTQAAAEQAELTAKVFEPAQGAVNALGGEVENVISVMQSLGDTDISQQAIELGRAWDEVAKKTAANEPALKELERLQQLINAAQANTSPLVAKAANNIQNLLVPALREAARLSGEIAKSTAGPQFGPNRMTGPAEFNVLPPITSSDVQGQILRDNAATTEAARKQGEADAKAYMAGMQPEFRSRLSAFLAAAQSEAGKISITSGFRTAERQAQLFAEAVKKYGSEEAARKWVAPPGRSNHGKGTAADLGYESEAVKQWAHANAEAYGLVFRLKNEDWHVELARQETVKQTAAAESQAAQATRDRTAATTDATLKTQELTDAEKQRLKATDDAKRAAVDMIDVGLTTFVSQLRQGASAADALKAALDDVLSVVIRLAINSVSGAIGEALGIPMRHSGGPVGLGGARRNVSPLAFVGAPRMHSGGVAGLMPNEVPTILKRGEIVLPSAKALTKGGTIDNSKTYLGDVSIVMGGTVAAGNDQAREWGLRVQKIIQAEMVKEKRPGGLLRA